MRALPTTDLYLGHVLTSSGSPVQPRNISRHLVRLGRATIAFRYLTEEELGQAEAERRAGQRLVYVIDDDLVALRDCPDQPDDYRERLANHIRSLKRFSGFDHLVCSNRRLAGSAVPHTTSGPEAIDPYWAIGAAPPWHRRLGRAISRHRCSLCFLGTRTHLTDLEEIREPLLEVLDRHAHLHLSTWLGENAPTWLQGRRQVRHRPPLEWTIYRRRIRRQTFELALYPLRDTPYNQGRSINKFLEHALVGAATLASTPGPLDRIAEAHPGWFAARRDDWIDLLNDLIGDRGLREQIASEQLQIARDLDRRAGDAQADLWSRLSGLDIPSPCRDAEPSAPPVR